MSEPPDSTVTESEGAPEPAPPGAAQATELRTFLIADIRGYTTYTRERGDEAGAELVRRFSEIVEEVVTARDGFLLELRGDEALVVFVSARKALRAAIDLQDRVVADGLPLGVGIGLDAGEAIPVGAGFRGTSLNLAARLCASAAAGETLASEAVIHLAAKLDGIAYVDARDLKVKGFDTSVRAVAVIHSDRTKGHRLAGGRSSSNRNRALVLALTGVAALAVVGSAFAAFLFQRASPSPGPTTPPTSAGVGAYQSSTPGVGPSNTQAVDSTPDPLALANLPLLAFYDASSGGLEGTTPLAGPRNIAFFAGGSYWILDNSKQFNRVDPKTHQITQRINVPIDEPNGYAYDDDYIWVTDLSGPRVVRIDQRSGTSGQPFDFSKDASDTSPATDVAAGGGYVWLARQDLNEILKLDPSTGAVVDTITADAWGMAYGGGAVWFWGDGNVGRIDPQTDTQTFEPAHVSDEQGLGNIYVAGDDAWTSTADNGIVYRVDRSGRVTQYPLDPGVGEMAPAADAMWVTNANTGTLTGIDVATGLRDRTINTGHATIGVASDADEIMVAVGPTVDEGIAQLPGSVLTVATDGIPFYNPGPDPPLNSDYQVRQALYLTCANLLIHPDAPGADGLKLVPEAATSLPAVSSDGLTYTFTVRPGLKFSPPSDEELTAETFRYSLERAVSPVYGDGDLGPRFFADIAGVSEYRAGTADHVSGLVVDGDKLVITLVAPAPDLLARLASSVACPVPTHGTPALRSGLGVDSPTAGAGPYYISETIRKRLVVLTKNPNYGGTRPRPFDEIAFRLEVAPNTSLQMVNDDEVDAAMFINGDPLTGPPSDLAGKWGPTGTNTSAGGQRWFGGPNTNVGFLVVNPTREPFDDPNVRHAVALALDRNEFSGIWVNGPTDELLVPSVEGSDPSLAVSPPDVEAAKALLNGQQLEMTMLGAPLAWNCGPCADFQNAVTRQLAAIGITVNLRYPPGEDYPGDGVFAGKSDVDMLVWGSGADYSDPVTLLQGLHDVPWVGQANIDELTRLEGVGGQARVDGAVALANQLVDQQFLIMPTGYEVFPFFISDQVACGFVQPAIGGVDLLSLCDRSGTSQSPLPTASP